MPAHAHTLPLQFAVDARVPISALMTTVDGSDVDPCGGVGPGSRRGFPLEPCVEAGAPDLQNLAQHDNRVVGLLLRDEAKPHLLSLAKKAVAFFRISRSISSRRTSLRSRRSSSRSLGDRAS